MFVFSAPFFVSASRFGIFSVLQMADPGWSIQRHKTKVPDRFLGEHFFYTFFSKCISLQFPTQCELFGAMVLTRTFWSKKRTCWFSNLDSSTVSVAQRCARHSCGSTFVVSSWRRSLGPVLDSEMKHGSRSTEPAPSRLTELSKSLQFFQVKCRDRDSCKVNSNCYVEFV